MHVHPAGLRQTRPARQRHGAPLGPKDWQQRQAQRVEAVHRPGPARGTGTTCMVSLPLHALDSCSSLHVHAQDMHGMLAYDTFLLGCWPALDMQQRLMGKCCMLCLHRQRRKSSLACSRPSAQQQRQEPRLRLCDIRQQVPGAAGHHAAQRQAGASLPCCCCRHPFLLPSPCP